MDARQAFWLAASAAGVGVGAGCVVGGVAVWAKAAKDDTDSRVATTMMALIPVFMVSLSLGSK